MGLAFCGLAFVAALVLTWRSLVAGIGAVLTTGYFFGIVRANYPDMCSHFIFDSAVLGFFLSYFTGGGLKTIADPKQQALQRWVGLLIGLAALMFLVPMQHPLIQLVGLRSNGFLLPFLLVGGRLTRDEAVDLAFWLGVLNHVAFAFAVTEFFMGVPAFYPENEVTVIIYRSGDVGGKAALRIPATFANSASYGGTMLVTLPWLVGAWIQPRVADWQKMFLLSGMALAMLGIFLCAGRTPLVLLALIVLAATFSGHLRGVVWLAWSVLIVGIIYVVSGEERMQRFMTLQDTDFVAQRIEGSVNMDFLELLVTYPFGNGIGAGGTSIPFFLHTLLRNPVGMENEYCRILLELGVGGLALWIAFMVWFLVRRPSDPRDPWLFGKQLLWFAGVASFAMGLLGTGLMTTIPQSMLFFVGVGFVVGAPVRAGRKAKSRTPPTGFKILARFAHRVLSASAAFEIGALRKGVGWPVADLGRRNFFAGVWALFCAGVYGPSARAVRKRRSGSWAAHMSRADGVPSAGRSP